MNRKEVDVILLLRPIYLPIYKADVQITVCHGICLTLLRIGCARKVACVLTCGCSVGTSSAQTSEPNQVVMLESWIVLASGVCNW